MGRTVGERQKNSRTEPDLWAGQLAGNRKIGTRDKDGVADFAAPFFIGDRDLKKYSKAEAIAIITAAAEKYDAVLNGRQFLIAYGQSDAPDFSVVGFRAHNFLHLTGVIAADKPNRFYQKALDHKLSERDFDFDRYGNAHLKLAVLPGLHRLFSGHTLRGSFARTGIRIETDYFVGSTAMRLALGFRCGMSCDFPVSLYCEDIRSLTSDSQKVLAVWVKAFGDADFEVNTYCAKGVSDPDSLLAQWKAARVQVGHINAIK